MHHRRGLLLTHVLTIALSASYITLGAFDTVEAERLWLPYAAAVMILVSINLWVYRRLER